VRISTLEFEGFGPYKERQFIDFDQLGESGLYLINGPTGAGKTTVIDAICFALYGKMASDDADDARARSDFCGPDDPTQVVLVFECAAGRFKVERSPDYMKTKKRGEGLTKAKAICNVYRILPGGEEVSIDDGAPDAKREIPRLVGLSRDQFVQTVVLPQGKFANFLNAKTQEREEILKSIFDTGLYETVADLLKERAKAISDRNREMGQDISLIVRHLGERAEATDEDIDAAVDLARKSLDDALAETLKTWSLPLQQRFEDATRKAESANSEFTAADTSRTLARDEAQAQDQLKKAESTMDKAADGCAQAQERMAAHELALSTLDVENGASAGIDHWTACATEVTRELANLEPLREAESEIERWPEVKKAHDEEVTGLQEQRRELLEKQEALPERMDGLQAIQEQRPTADDWEDLNNRRSKIKRIQETRDELDEEQKKVSKLEEEVRQAQEVAKVASEELANGSRTYLSGIAAELASSLDEGSPCSVCGSTEHPAPANPEPDAITYEMVEALRTKDRKALAALNQLTGALEKLRDSVLALGESLTTSPQEEEQEAKSVEDLAENLATREKDAKAAQSELGKLREDQKSLDKSIADIDTSLGTKQQDHKYAAEEIEKKTAKVRQGRHGFDSIEARITALRALELDVKKLIDALRADDQARDAVAKAKEKLAEFPDREGFADVEAAEEAWQQADECKKSENKSLVTAQRSHQEFTDQCQKITDLATERATLVGDNQGLIRLAEIFDSGRGTEYGLHIYVLRTLFDKVMALANQRFQSLLDGRYRLITQDDSGGDQRKYQGLGVAVQDSLTGKVRSAMSLSGGETFCASLALALGLSDAVRMNAGGIRIDSLFIDEGFGSLDNAQLDEVMNMLNQLSTEGCRVGLISHVDSMKETMNERIDIHAVRKDRPTSLSVSWMQ